MQALAQDMGFNLKVRLWVDSNAAKAIVSRVGIGKFRHMEVKYLLTQLAHRTGRFEVKRVDGKHNPADMSTKPKSASEIVDMLLQVGCLLLKREEQLLEKWAYPPKMSSWADESGR